eukprot:5627127-Lingulodinium_polyedra.AAC.1
MAVGRGAASPSSRRMAPGGSDSSAFRSRRRREGWRMTSLSSRACSSPLRWMDGRSPKPTFFRR